MTKDPTERRTPADSDDDWHYLWRGAQIAHIIGPILLPIAGLIRDWKFWVVAIGIVGWANRPDIAMALKTLAGQ